ncbi:MAG: hypothetical protein F6J89_06350 [Symploca sp. SIO1C4]|uniref:Uncharacterized protein n=1 Tax=Symploca sp. SIO1C4 TaxID=2607765 RepID=A0A6B3NB44_9CYAN|nr:hypothetical protein [Symploca sp. SIO1C4]
MIKNFTLKKHVSPHTKTINKALQSKFGFGLGDLDAALSGNQTKLKQIGEAARQGKLTAELMPLLEQAYSQIIEGTTAYNTSVDRILKQGASSAISIDKAISQAVLANQKYINQRKEIKGDFIQQRDAETARHKYAIDYAQLKAYIDTYLVGVDREAQILQQANRPELKQIEENQRYELAAIKHLLKKGEKARLNLIPKRNYVREKAPRKPGIVRRINQVKEALGF